MAARKIESLLKLRPVAAAVRAAEGADAPDFELVCYGDIGESWWGDSVSAKDVVEQLQDVNATHIRVRINSYGGSVTDGLAIHNALRAQVAAGVKVSVRIEGVAASIASLIAMAGDEREMYPNALLMIHAPWTIAAGNSAQMRELADVLDTHAKAMATSYARATGNAHADELELLTDGIDHWFSADEAKAEGYASAVLEQAEPEPETEARAMPRQAPMWAAISRYRNAPRDIAASVQKPTAPVRLSAITVTQPIHQPAASAANPKECFMNWKATAQSLGLTLPENATDHQAKAVVLAHLGLAGDATDGDVTVAIAKRLTATALEAANAQARETQRRKDIEASFAPFRNRGESFAQLEREMLGDMTVSAQTAREKLLAKLGEGAEPLGGGLPSVQVGATSDEKRVDAMVQATLVRAGIRKDPDSGKAIAFEGANPYRGLTLREMARAALRASGRNPDGMDVTEVARAVLIRGAQTTSDFPVYLENTIHKMVLTGFMAAPSVWQRFCKVGSVTDLRDWSRIVPGMIGNLDLVNEAGEYKNKNLPDGEKEPVRAKRRGNIIEITPEVIINDDLAAITDTARGLGAAGPRTVDRLVFALLALNGNMGPTLTKDGQTLIHNTHGNTNTGAATVAKLSAMAEKMKLQKLPGDDQELLDLGPAIAVARPSVAGDIQVLVEAQYDNDGTALQKPNKVRGLLTDVVGTARMPATIFYLFADPNVAPAIEVVFLDGQQQVRVVPEENFRTGGLAWRGELNVGAGAIDYRGIQYSSGTG